MPESNWLGQSVPPTNGGILGTVTASAMREAKEVEHDDLGASPVQAHANVQSNLDAPEKRIPKRTFEEGPRGKPMQDRNGKILCL